MGIDLRDYEWYYPPSGAHRYRLHRAYCDLCGKDRGYQQKKNAHLRCNNCKGLKIFKVEDVPLNVDANDYIQIKQGTRRVKKFRTRCPTCGADREYQKLEDAPRNCYECSVAVKLLIKFPNVNPADFIVVSNEGDGVARRAYKIPCEDCGMDIGYSSCNKKKVFLCDTCKKHRNLGHCTQVFLDNFEKITPAFAEVIPASTYVDIRTSIEVRCIQCQKNFWALPANLLRGQKCPACFPPTQPRGEEQITLVLEKYGIEYIKQHRFSDCRDSLPLPFDVYIPALSLCVEYDGKQHYKPVKWFGGEEAFKKTKERDAIKNKYCKDKDTGITLIRISYKDFDRIEEILTEKLTKLGALSGDTQIAI